MIRNLVFLLALIGACISYTYYADKIIPAPETENAARPSALQKAPDFTFTSLDGRIYSLNDFSGKVVILNFWASWCTPCVVEFPQMIDLSKKTKDKSVLIFLSVDETKEDIERFLKKQKGYEAANIFIAHDADKSISQGLFQTYKLPETYILTPDLAISEKIVGADIVWNAPEMVAKIESLAR